MPTSFNANKSTGLPTIPSFPPIEIPSASGLRSSVDHLPPLDEDSHLSSSAFTSHSPPSFHQPLKSTDGTAQPSPTSPSALFPNLRKSFSVDSFSRPSRTSPVNVSSRQRGGAPTSLAVSDEQRRSHLSSWHFQALESPQISCVPRDPSFPLSERSRGTSVSTTGYESSPSIPEESSGDVVRDIPNSSTGVKRTKIRGKLRPTLPPGELPLPSKLRGTNPVTPAISRSSNESTPRLPAATIEELLHRRSKAGPSYRPSRGDITGLEGTSNTAGSDSGSTVLESVSLTLLGCLIYARNSTNDLKVSVAVIGEKGCGKSAAISKGLKAYKLTEPVIVPDNSVDESLHQSGYATSLERSIALISRSTSDTLREGKVTDEHGADAVLKVLEVDVALLKSRLESNMAMWPEQAPLLDGVILCCDVSKKDSFAEVEDVLRLYILYFNTS